MKRIMLVISVMLLAGCSLSGIDKQPGKMAYGPEGSDAQYGIASYVHGALWVENDRREDTYKKMYESCGGKYRIVKEQDTPQTMTFKYECLK